MGAVKIRASDSYFSKCIRERAEWKCERCGAQHKEGSMGLHCSHYYGRGTWSTRFDKDNCEALCYGCHSFMGANPAMHEQRIREKLGPYAYDALVERKNDIKAGRQMKRDEALVRKHYKAELENLKARRASGESGYLEFTGY